MAGFKNNKKRRGNEGFTLVEVIVVLVILAVLAAILIPSMIGWIERSEKSAVLPSARLAYEAAQTIATEHYGEGYTGQDGKTNHGIFSNQAEAERDYHSTAVFSVDAGGNIRSNIESGIQMAELADISASYVCWVHFKKGTGIYIDGVAFAQNGYVAYLDMTNSRWHVTEDKQGVIKQMKTPNFVSTLKALFGTDDIEYPNVD